MLLKLVIHVLYSLVLVKLSWACFGYEAHIKDTSLVNTVLSGKSFKTFANTTFRDCFLHCTRFCLCRSFNLEVKGRRICELNDADKSDAPEALLAKSDFIHVEFRVINQESESNAPALCCSKNPCQNGGTCLPELRSGKPTFSCKCSEGYFGKLCQSEINSCADILSLNQSAHSGLYKIRLTEVPAGNMKTVYCHFNQTEHEAWTLVMSYNLSNKDDFKKLPFHDDRPFNEGNPTFHKYRASQTLMTHLKKKSLFWRATCNYNTKVNDDDYMQSSFTTLDIMTYEAHSCKRLDELKLYGKMYKNQSTWVVQDTRNLDKRTFYISASYGSQQKCDVDVKVIEDGLFGWYVYESKQHGCSAATYSTTQYWFGTKL